jgi:hypothetical protein
MRARPLAVLGVGALVPVALLATSCGNDGPGDTERFCREVEEHLPQLTTNPATLEEVEGFLDVYRRIGDVAPLEIEPHWDALVLNYETASTVEPDDPESLQQARARAYATEGSAVAVRDFLLTNCNVDMGPITTIVPHSPTQPTGTPPPTTTAPG